MINGQNFFDHSIKNYIKANENIKKTASGQGYDCITDCLLVIPISKKIKYQ